MEICNYLCYDTAYGARGSVDGSDRMLQAGRSLDFPI
jgi:hypothetical protein